MRKERLSSGNKKNKNLFETNLDPLPHQPFSSCLEVLPCAFPIHSFLTLCLCMRSFFFLSFCFSPPRNNKSVRCVLLTQQQKKTPKRIHRLHINKKQMKWRESADRLNENKIACETYWERGRQSLSLQHIHLMWECCCLLFGISILVLHCVSGAHSVFLSPMYTMPRHIDDKT